MGDKGGGKVLRLLVGEEVPYPVLCLHAFEGFGDGDGMAGDDDEVGEGGAVGEGGEGVVAGLGEREGGGGGGRGGGGAAEVGVVAGACGGIEEGREGAGYATHDKVDHGHVEDRLGGKRGGLVVWDKLVGEEGREGGGYRLTSRQTGSSRFQGKMGAARWGRKVMVWEGNDRHVVLCLPALNPFLSCTLVPLFLPPSLPSSP